MTTVFDKNKKRIHWKGKTFQSVSASLSKNINNLGTTSEWQSFRSRPLKLYRKEISSTSGSCNPRTSIKIDHLNMPGGSNFSSITNPNGIENTVDINLTNNSYEIPKSDNTHCIANEFSPEKNALRRVRSSGMNRSSANNNNKYYTSTNQYLDSRNLSYKNNANFVTTSYQDNNEHIPSSTNDCPAYRITFKPNNSKFYTQGAVSSGDLITRKKIDTITNVGSSFRTPFGSHTANAVSYGVPSYGYTIKDKKGFPLKKTPVFSKFSSIMQQCPARKFSNIY